MSNVDLPEDVVNGDDHTGSPVRVRWIDSGLHLDGWRTGMKDVPIEPPLVETVGIWMGEGTNIVAVASTRGEGGAWLNVQVIWKPSITAKVWL